MPVSIARYGSIPIFDHDLLMRLDDVAQFYFFDADDFDAYTAIGVAF